MGTACLFVLLQANKKKTNNFYCPAKTVPSVLHKPLSVMTISIRTVVILFLAMFSLMHNLFFPRLDTHLCTALVSVPTFFSRIILASFVAE